MAPPKKTFFHSEELKLWERRVIYFYLTISILLCILYLNSDWHLRKNILVGYGIGTQLSLFFVLYTSLRNLKSYLIWCCFGFFHLAVYFTLKNDPDLQMPSGNAATCLRNTIVLILLFQVLRYISLKLQHREFVAPAYGGGKDLFENKKVGFIDFLIFILYYGSLFVLFFLSLDQQ